MKPYHENEKSIAQYESKVVNRSKVGSKTLFFKYKSI